LERAALSSYSPLNRPFLLMNLYNHAEREAAQDEAIRLTDQWPNCDQERAIELYRAFKEFKGWNDPEVANHKSPRHELLYEIKRGDDKQRLTRYVQATREIEAEIERRDAEAGTQTSQGNAPL
jgi:hypothetical protein